MTHFQFLAKFAEKKRGEHKDISFLSLRPLRPLRVLCVKQFKC